MVDGNPEIIQGGMGVGVSSWGLARAVSRTGQLGVVSGVALDVLLARRLQLGDPDGHMRRALAHFPVPAVARAVLERYYVEGGLPAGRPFRPVPRLGVLPRRIGQQLTVVANFVEVFLAKDGHDGPVGINYLEKIQMATAPAVYGAMLAGVDYVLMGAGLPTEIPGLLDALALHRPARLSVSVHGALPGEGHHLALDPGELLGEVPGPLRRPRLLAIVSSATLALYLARDEATRPDGFVVETRVAGGHSARPRGKLVLDSGGEPVYGPRDRLDLPKIAALGLPFWLAGGQADPRRLAEARSAGAAGIQVGTAFALCRESGMEEGVRRQLVREARSGALVVHNDVRASPTGFPFKVAPLPGTTGAEDVYAERPRRCDLSYLRTPYRRPDGAVGYRCPAEPVDEYVRKGGAVEDTVGSRCLCNGLVATIGLGQRRDGDYTEPPLVTLGQDVAFLAHLTRDGDDYRAADVIGHLLGDARRTAPVPG
ncbi:nitronate monooxygenase [Actinoplanes teichomyceticus]|uniref:NAD(P)H-dependent flavin oxidoreductase YrpB (Nitropropane dioxygenase family) n=1 Tax=Actinoplanes teichomyceticus TaxID=1867 RepID=A0A561VCR7_ACTTI|nr:nitronate monooxygenase [Actinoplanes teichomyceticus]TWG09400.1 NAD(P)H-dependent flavin oxidoreductase YrpB (nitropropane dioxygenase family) [Actinoplanes teichomyceticus]GIF17017.1 2-nitropropane dioxygenase [Actinoplanes teichomyceticus]